jgi:thioredoxin-related protein
MKQTRIISILAAVVLIYACGPEKHLEDKLVWHPYKEVEATFPKAARPIFFYISEQGCHNCDEIKKSVLSRPEIAWFLNSNYLSVNVDLVTDLPITIGGKLYDRDAFIGLFTGNTPNFVFFDTTGDVNGLFQGNLDLKTFKQLLKYVHAGHFGRTMWEDYLKMDEAVTDTVLGVF